MKEGQIVAENVFNKRKIKMNYDNQPCVCFSLPPIGHCGLNEKEAGRQYEAEGKVVKVFTSEFTNMFYSPSTDDNIRLKSLFKIICV